MSTPPNGRTNPRLEAVEVVVGRKIYRGEAVLTPNGLVSWQLDALWMAANDPHFEKHKALPQFRQQVTEQLEAKLRRPLAYWQLNVVAWRSE